MQSEDTHSEAKVNLARRAVACKRWRWMPGMLTIDGDRILATTNASPDAIILDATVCCMSDRDIDVDVRIGLYDGALPDLDDPATLGCLLALVREAWGRHVSSIRTDAGWTMRRMGASGWVVGLPVSDAKATEDESLVAALEAAP